MPFASTTVRPKAFTLIEFVVLLVVGFALLALVLVACVSKRGHPRHDVQTNTQLRGIHQSMFTFSQSNRDYFPGLNSKGRTEPPDNGFVNGVGGEAVTYRFAELLTADFFTGEYAVSPVEVKDIWTDPEISDVTLAHLSYALPEIAEAADAVSRRRAAWRGDLETGVPMVTDRNAGPERGEALASIHGEAAGAWRGGVAWADNHVSFETTHELATSYLDRAGQTGRHEHPADDLFEAAGLTDAWQVFR